MRLLGLGPALLSFGRPTFEATNALVACTYPIKGGLLAQRAAGEIIFAQVEGSPTIVRSTIAVSSRALPLARANGIGQARSTVTSRAESMLRSAAVTSRG